jgi:hypothetical protein
MLNSDGSNLERKFMETNEKRFAFRAAIEFILWPDAKTQWQHGL